MSIDRIEEVVYGVEDLAEAARFFADVGLTVVREEPDLVSLSTGENQRVTLRRQNDPALPPAIEDEPGIRMLIWGVSDRSDLDRLANEFGDAAVWEGETLAVTDPVGLRVGFRVMDHVRMEPVFRPHNQHDHHERVNETLGAYGQGKPIRIIHCAMNITKAINAEALDFYENRLHFKATDKILDTGTFMQTDGDVEHHNFFLCFRPDSNGTNHIAFEVYDMDAVIEAGNYMITKGWKESRRLGRHLLGSNVFRFIHTPCGGRIEFVADMDRNDKSFETRVHEKNPGHHLWMLKSSGADPKPAG